MLRKKNQVVNIREKILKKQLLKLFVLAVLLCFAFVLDNYLEKESVEITGKNTQKNRDTEEPCAVYFFVQSTTTSGAKILAQKTSMRKFLQKSHDKFIQKYHQLRNYQLLKCEAENLKEPLILTFHSMGFRNYLHGLSDDVPLIF